MKPELDLDFAKAIRQIDQINKLVHAARAGFAFTENDQYAKEQKKLREFWLKLKNEQNIKK